MSEPGRQLRASVARRTEELLQEHRRTVQERTDRWFALLMALQWAAGIVAALIMSPRTWAGSSGSLQLQVWTAVLAGGMIASLPVALALLRPGRPTTRYVIAGAQMLFSALLIHLTGGRIETHFHVFGSLAILALYRDWRVFVPATAVVALDHVVRGLFWPQSVFGVFAASQWRWLEHACWIIFQEIFLVRSSLQSAREMRQIAHRRAQLEHTQEVVELEDITARKLAEEREASLGRILDDSINEIYIFDADTIHFILVNRGARENTGYSMEELQELTPLDLKPDYTRESFEELLAPLRSGELQVQVFETVHRRKDGSTYSAEVRLQRSTLGNAEVFVALILDTTARREAEKERARLTTAVEQAAESIMVTDLDGAIRYVNPAFERITGYTREEILGANPRVLKSDVHGNEHYADFWRTILAGRVWKGPFVNRRKDGSLYEADATVSPIRGDSGEITNFVAVTRDVTQQKALEVQLGQSRKMEAIGQLAAGIAHEINTPTQYVGDNTRFLAEAFHDLLSPLQALSSALAEADGNSLPPETLERLRRAVADADVDYLAEEIPRAVEQSLDGVARVTRIVRAMKNFSHPAEDKTPTDLNKAIDGAITVARNEWKYVADLRTDFGDDLEAVPCIPGDFNQAMLNVIVNAAHAIAGVVGSGKDKGEIRVRTRRLDEWAEIRITDSGCGIPEEIRERIFDPFFTTKEIGKGTGQGLSIVHNIVVKKHGGTLAVESEVGRGTTFILRLPLEAAAEVEVGAVVRRSS